MHLLNPRVSGEMHQNLGASQGTTRHPIKSLQNDYPLVISIDNFPMPSSIWLQFLPVLCMWPPETAPLKSFWLNPSMPLKPWVFWYFVIRRSVENWSSHNSWLPVSTNQPKTSTIQPVFVSPQVYDRQPCGEPLILWCLTLLQWKAFDHWT